MSCKNSHVYLKKGDAVIPDDFSEELQFLLLRPTRDPEDDPLLYDLLMRLVVSLSVVPPEVLYAYNKSHFFAQYMNWSLSKRKGAVHAIKTNRLQRAQKVTT